MLQRLALSDLDELEKQCGLWSRVELERMNQDFVAACERAFELRLESRVAASATIRLNGDARRIEMAVERAWVWFCRRDREKEVAFSEILARCPGVDPCKVREGFARRFKQFGCEIWA